MTSFNNNIDTTYGEVLKKGKIMATLTIIILVGLGYFKGMGIYSSSKKVELGVKESALMLCGDKPNCVSTSNSDEKHMITAIETDLDLDNVVKELNSLDLKLVTKEGNYAHLTYTSGIMGYVDDVEIMLNGQTLTIRSASRVGYSDMGANRKRVEKIRELLK
jgi:uncharacterized protein (DUF1499 family)